MQIAVINQSTLVSGEQAGLMCLAVNLQLEQHVLPAWNMKEGSVKFYPDPSQVPADAWLVSILDNSTQAGALGYHSEDGDKIDGFIFAGPVLNDGGVALYDGSNPQRVSVSSVLSHEVCEMVGDWFASYWADGPAIQASDGQVYNQYALELCDPVEGNSYPVVVNGCEVSVSNFVYPNWFNKQATAKDAPFDYLHKLTAPFTMTPGGYMILRRGDTYQQVFGEKVSPEIQLHIKSEWYRR